MAVTRINNNQISSASAGNVLLGINANTKLQNFSITSNKIANNLTYGSDLTIAGNLTVQGNSTAIDTTITTIEDPVIVLASTQTGAPAVDIGFIGERGDSDNIAFVWDESAGQFVTAFTSTSETNTTISISSYANLQTANITAANVYAPAIINNGAYNTKIELGNTTGIIAVTTNGNSTQFGPTGVITVSGASQVVGGSFGGSGITLGTSQTDIFQNRGGNVTVQVGTGGTIANTWTFAQGGDLLAPGNISAVGNIIGNNLITTGVTNTGTLETTGNALIGGNLIVQGNISYININDLRVEDPVIILGTGPNGAPLTVNDGLDRGIYMEYYISNVGTANAFMGFDNSTGNMFIANDVNFVANDVVGVNSYGTLQAGNLYIQSAVSIGNVAGGNLTTAGQVVATGNVNGGNIVTSNTVTGANVIGTASVRGGNIVLSGDDITDTNGRVNFNTAGADVDFAVNGDTVANVFYVDAGTGTASFGTSTQTVNAIAAFNATTSILAPVGNTAQRPAIGVTGMLRFNTTDNAVEVYNNTQWESVGVQTFTLIADEQFNGDGSTVAFTLGSTQTTNSCIVSINGVVQIPTIAYSVSGVDPTCVLTFTEAPAAADLIDVRQLTTTTSVTSIASSSGNAVVSTSETAANVNVTGNLVISGSVSAAGFIGLDATKIANGTSQMAVLTANGNIQSNVAGSTVMNISAGLIGVTGNITPTANVTYDLGTTTNRWKDIWLSGSTIYMGNAQISANATSLIFTNPGGGTTVLAGATAAITGATVSTTGNISSAANVNATTGVTTGTLNAQIVQGGSITGSTVSAVGNVTGGNLLVGTLHISANAISCSDDSITIGGTGTVGNVIIAGNLQVLGNTTTINSNNVTTNDLILSVANNAINSAAASGAGLEVGNINSPFISWLYSSVSNAWISSGSVSAAGNVLGDQLFVNGIQNSGGNGAGNIGSSTTYFNTVFAKATSAQYADLAEKYTADAAYAPGTVLVFGGTAEVTVNAVEGDTKVAGVVSTNPSYIMNSGLTGEHVATVALTGRVPTMVHGPVRKGDLMVAAGLGRAQSSADPKVGSVIGKALEDFNGTEGTIEVVVGRF
jgi:hypothetical protein